MHIQHFSLQAMGATGRQRRLLWPLLTLLALMLQPVQACCTLTDAPTESGHHADTHHTAPDSHCDMEVANSGHFAVAFRVRTGSGDIVPGTPFFPRIASACYTAGPSLPPFDRVIPAYPPPWLLTLRLRI